MSSRISQDRLGAPEVSIQRVTSGDCACDLEAGSRAPPGPGNLVLIETTNRAAIKQKRSGRCQGRKTDSFFSLRPFCSRDRETAPVFVASKQNDGQNRAAEPVAAGGRRPQVKEDLANFLLVSGLERATACVCLCLRLDGWLCLVSLPQHLSHTCQSILHTGLLPLALPHHRPAASTPTLASF